jgi:hypothetical protein
MSFASPRLSVPGSLNRPPAFLRAGDDVLRARFLALVLALLAVTGLSLTAINEVTWEQRGLVFVMFALSGCSYAHWRYDRRRTLPVYAVVSGVYTLFLCPGAVLGDAGVAHYMDQGVPLPQEALTASLRMVVLGLVSVWIDACRVTSLMLNACPIYRLRASMDAGLGGWLR